MKNLIRASTAALAISLAAGNPSLPPLAAASGPSVHDLVFVTEGTGFAVDGCNGISVARLDRDEPAHRGHHGMHSGRLTATSDFSLILAGPSGPLGYPHYRLPATLSAVRRQGADWTSWTDYVRIAEEAAPLAPAGGIAIMPDDVTLLVSTVGDPWSPAYLPPPYRVMRFFLSEMRRQKGEWNLGQPRGSIELPGIAAEILPSADGRRAYVLTEYGTVLTIDPSTMTEVAPRIQLQPPEVPGTPPGTLAGYFLGNLQAALSADERYLVVNRLYPPELNVADLQSHTAWTLPTAADVAYTGGIAINRGWVNPGLLALHAVDKVIVYRFNPHGPLQELSRFPIARRMAWRWMPGPRPSVAWSTSGAELIFANNIYAEDEGGNVRDGHTPEFTILSVHQGGSQLVHLRDIVVCPSRGDNPPYGVNLPLEILTANGRVTPPPRPTPSPTTGPPLSPTPTATVSPPANASPSPTASATGTPTPSAGRAYLPFALRSTSSPRPSSRRLPQPREATVRTAGRVLHWHPAGCLDQRRALSGRQPHLAP